MSHFKHEQAIVGPKAKVGKDTRVWAFTNIEDGAVVGDNCNICDGCFIEKGAVIGNNVTIKNNVAIFNGVTIEDDVFIGTNTTFTNDRYPRSNRQEEWTLEKTTIKKGVSIGSNVTVLCGLTLGEYTLVGAGSVVTKSFKDHSFIFGNPAQLKGHACACGRQLEKDWLRCSSCGREYSFREDGIRLNE